MAIRVWITVTLGYVLESDPQCNDLKEVKKVLKVSILLLVIIYKFVFQLAFSDSVQYPQKLFYKLLGKHYIAASEPKSRLPEEVTIATVRCSRAFRYGMLRQNTINVIISLFIIDFHRCISFLFQMSLR